MFHGPLAEFHGSLPRPKQNCVKPNPSENHTFAALLLQKETTTQRHFYQKSPNSWPNRFREWPKKWLNRVPGPSPEQHSAQGLEIAGRGHLGPHLARYPDGAVNQRRAANRQTAGSTVRPPSSPVSSGVLWLCFGVSSRPADRRSSGPLGVPQVPHLPLTSQLARLPGHILPLNLQAGQGLALVRAVWDDGPRETVEGIPEAKAQHPTHTLSRC